MFTEVDSIAVAGPAIVVLGYQLGILDLVDLVVAVVVALTFVVVRGASRRARRARIEAAERALAEDLAAQLAERRLPVGASRER